MEDLIKYFREKYTITANDLRLNDLQRAELLAKLDMIDEIEEIFLKGFPNDNE